MFVFEKCIKSIVMVLQPKNRCNSVILHIASYLRNATTDEGTPYDIKKKNATISLHYPSTLDGPGRGGKTDRSIKKAQLILLKTHPRTRQIGHCVEDTFPDTSECCPCRCECRSR